MIVFLLSFSFPAAGTGGCWDWDEEMVVSVGWGGKGEKARSDGGLVGDGLTMECMLRRHLT